MTDNRRADDLKELAARTNMNRRDFMGAAAAAGLTASMSSTLWSQVAKAAPSRGGHLRVGTDGGASSDTFNPLQTIGTDHITQSTLCCYDTLTEVDSNGTPMPSLAESWDVSDDGKTWAFKLRAGVEFHNGKSLTPADVVWSLSQHKSEENAWAEGKQIIGNLEEIRADGDNTVVLVQNEVNYDLPAHMSATGLFVAPEGTTDWDKGNGTGPYMLEHYEPGERLTGKRFANFYRDDQGYFDSVELLNIADANTRSSALRTDAVDVIGQPDTKTAKRLGEVDGLALLEIPSGQHFTTAMRTDTDPFTDNNIRQAVKYGINRQEILEKVFGGYGYVGNDHPIGRNLQFYNDQLPQREYDPDRAKHHLAQAGLSEITLELAASDGAFNGSVDMAVLMQESMKDAGITVNVKNAAPDGYWSDTWLTHPWCCVYWNGRPTVDWNLSLGYISTTSWNDTYFKNERFDSLVIGARTERDENKRRDMYFECQEILHNEGGTTVVMFASNLIAKSGKLGHGDVSGLRRMDDARLARRWWFEA